jgi:hypothetical protein
MLARQLLHQPSRQLLVAQSRINSRVTTGLISKRFRVGDFGDNKSGHINTTPEQGILFFNNVLPPNLQWFFRLSTSLEKKSPFSEGNRTAESLGIVHPQTLFNDATKSEHADQVAVVEVLPRLREGGAFLKFSYNPSTDPQAVAQSVRNYLRQHHIRSWWNPLGTVKASLVQGEPWVEDLSRRPSRRLRVEFLPTEPGNPVAELSQEQLYGFFRSFGKLSEIVPQASDSKILPRFAYLDYFLMSRAIMAKNCLHGYVVTEAQGGGKTGTLLRLSYERKERFKWFKDTISGHSRIVLPLLAALVAGISIAVFDPIRTFSIKAHITRTFHVEDNVVFRWFRRTGEDFIKNVRELSGLGQSYDAGMEVVWEDRKSEVEKIQAWLMESMDTFIIVQGPRGSGKKELVIDHALRHKIAAKRVLVIDCKPVAEARGDAATIAAAAAQTGYRPVFSWINNVSGLIDLASQGLTGVKAGFSETVENQLAKIWGNTSAALKSIALESRGKNDKDAKLSDDEYLEAHPEHRPVVVIENFLHRSADPGASLVYDKLAQWAAELTTSNIAHVIFLTNDVAFSKSLSKALPDRVFHQIALGDCSPEIAKRYVINRLDFDADVKKEVVKEGDEEVKVLTPSQKRKDLHELDEVIGLLGGRLTDLEFFARRIKAGETPSKAAREIIEQSASEILKMFLLKTSEERGWNTLQAWTVIRQLAENDSLRFNELLLSDSFKTDGDKAIAALEQAELVTVQSYNGRPVSLKPGKPVYQSAFQRLINDNVLRAKMDLALLNNAISSQTKTIEKLEQELHLLAELPRQPIELRDRVQWLLTNISSAQKKIDGFEKESADLKKILTTEY